MLTEDEYSAVRATLGQAKFATAASGPSMLVPERPTYIAGTVAATEKTTATRTVEKAANQPRADHRARFGPPASTRLGRVVCRAWYEF